MSGTQAPTKAPARVEPANRREQILEETLRIVARRGYHGFGISELADRCGLTKAGLLHHFGSKEQLLISLLQDCQAKEAAELSRLFLPAYATAAPAEQRRMFRDTMRLAMERALAQPELMRLGVILRAEAVNSSHPAHALIVERENANRERVVERLSPFLPHAESTARQLLSLMNGLQEQWLREDESFDLLAEWDRALEMLLGQSRG